MKKFNFPVLPLETPQIRSPWRRIFGISYLSILGWRIEGNLPNLPKFVLVVAPHTSNWDFVIGILVYFALQLQTVWFVKHTALKGPWARLVRYFGAIAIDRNRAVDVVKHYVEEINRREKMVITITPEGTRKKAQVWKRGFYRIACDANIPIVTIALDFSTRRVVLGLPFTPSGDYERDLPAIKGNFNSAMARHPEQF